MHLEELSLPLSRIRGIGPASQKTLHAMGIRSVRDLLWHVPREYQDRTLRVPLSAVRGAADHDGVWVNTVAVVQAHEFFGPGPRKTLKILIDDGSADAVLVCFGRNFLANQLRVGSSIAVCGRAQYRFREIQLAAFEFEVLRDAVEAGGAVAGPGHTALPGSASLPASSNFGRILPVYPLGGDLSQAFFRKSLELAIQSYGRLVDEVLPAVLVQRHGFMARGRAFQSIHFPAHHEDQTEARRRLVYEELFFLQIQVAGRALERRRIAFAATGQGSSRGAGVASQAPSQRPSEVPLASRPDWPELLVRLRDSLPFSLTTGQIEAVDDLLADLEKPWPLSRLVQGDVGSGKTLVALLAACAVVAKGGQVALMVPTVLLARQHAEKAATLLEPLGIRVGLFAGSLGAAARRSLLGALEQGHIDLVVGTHGLIGNEVRYKALDLAIIDEQHRFGVLQRQALHQKSRRPNLVMMSATPIPQTLALTVFGDMEISSITTLPASRKPIETHLARMGNEQKVYDWVDKELSKGRQAYFVYPLIDTGFAPENSGGESSRDADSSTEGPGLEVSGPSSTGSESPASELKNAEAMFRTLSETVFPGRKAGMIHSRMEEEAKESVMKQFSSGELEILVATSVVEVGVDVPNASCMVVEHAERFGLAALHQIRGRVGRGSEQSYCFLVYQDPLSDEAKRRLKMLKESNDGFAIAEEDLAIRGPGDIKGTQQSGFLRLRIADLSRDMAIMNVARADAFSLLEDDPALSKPENQNLKRVLELMSQEEARENPEI